MTAATANVTPLRSRSATESVWLSPAQVADRIPGMTVANLQELRKRGKGPAYSKPTLKTVVYAQADVDAWVARSRVSTKEQS